MSKIKIQHFRDPYETPSGPAITVVSRLVDDPKDPRRVIGIEFAIAICGHGDTFSRKRGVEIATDRLENDWDSAYYRYIKFDRSFRLTGLMASIINRRVASEICLMDIPDWAQWFMWRMTQHYGI